MKQKIQQIIRLARTILGVIVIIGAVAYIYAHNEPQPQVDRVQELYTFYQTSGHDYQWEYKKDLEELKREKQTILDTLNYKQTVQFYQNGTYDSSISETKVQKLQMIDDTIVIANQKVKELPEPDYTTMNQASKPTTPTSGLDFMKLLK